MTTGIWILGDQLYLTQAALQSCHDSSKVAIIFIESYSHIKKHQYHKQKLVLVWSAMRHFAEELRKLGYSVTYKIAEDFQTPLQQWVNVNQITELLVMSPNDKPFLKTIEDLTLACDITLLPNNQFLWSTEEFDNWAKKRKRLLMEDFYREGRRRFDILMEADKPIGGKWNLDAYNRKPPARNLNTPEPLWFEPDEITQEVIQQVDFLDIATYGEIKEFRWGVTRSQALSVLRYFIDIRLPEFGPYQDAMVTGEETMWHAMLSPYLNLGLLQPLEIIQAAEQAYHEKQLALNSVEGFIRQVLGWREYMHGIYHHVDTDYSQQNWFEHHKPLPEFYWTGETKMNCLHQILTQVMDTGYAHHIQRLMVLNNFGLIAGISPQELENWFHTAFIDAYDWVMQTNVIGMGQYADGGLLASKPYAASANYINKMSDYCKSCDYKHSQRIGAKACPFNFLYWDFLNRHRDKLKHQGRMNFILKNLDKISPEDLETIHQQAENIF
ncbi:cryptochrome/photolyase family protein [Plectonema cf. radiosum LEGE 06105]|uniref:Cryptochrome/photolyase family protein n=1 Tax=Plectonema cf. radiosum LEGE 06105 TaxID=945769 RepID=A0A8J7EYE8_9CYAN|nr:cryptochrome/photolyase family protein [Plectonema radiosum]MBE9212098.1 cryptochrome/photolyase family protein [Plectonema cf. radiosum LEGE 06105]